MKNDAKYLLKGMLQVAQGVIKDSVEGRHQSRALIFKVLSKIKRKKNMFEGKPA